MCLIDFCCIAAYFFAIGAGGFLDLNGHIDGLKGRGTARLLAVMESAVSSAARFEVDS